MTDSQIFYLVLAIWAIAYGVSVFVPDRVIIVISGIAAIVTGIVALLLAF